MSALSRRAWDNVPRYLGFINFPASQACSGSVQAAASCLLACFPILIEFFAVAHRVVSQRKLAVTVDMRCRRRRQRNQPPSRRLARRSSLFARAEFGFAVPMAARIMLVMLRAAVDGNRDVHKQQKQSAAVHAMHSYVFCLRASSSFCLFEGSAIPEFKPIWVNKVPGAEPRSRVCRFCHWLPRRNDSFCIVCGGGCEVPPSPAAGPTSKSQVCGAVKLIRAESRHKQKRSARVYAFLCLRASYACEPPMLARSCEHLHHCLFEGSAISEFKPIWINKVPGAEPRVRSLLGGKDVFWRCM